MSLSHKPVPHGAATDDHRIDRISAAGAQDVLDRLQNTALLESGAVNVIGLDAIRRKLGDRWPHKRSQIWEHVERELERNLGPADIFLRTDDISYMIAQPGSAGFAAQSICLSILQDILKFFLGESRGFPTSTCARSHPWPAWSGDLRAGRPEQAETRDGAAPAETPAEQMAQAVTGPLADHAPAAQPWTPPLAGRSSTIELAPPKTQSLRSEN